MKEQNVPGGWITAEYSMLPYSTLPAAREIFQREDWMVVGLRFNG